MPLVTDQRAELLGRLRLDLAWTGLLGWTVAGLGFLSLRVRRVEVVT